MQRRTLRSGPSCRSERAWERAVQCRPVGADVTGTCMFTRWLRFMTECLLKSLWSCFFEGAVKMEVEWGHGWRLDQCRNVPFPSGTCAQVLRKAALWGNLGTQKDLGSQVTSCCKHVRREGGKLEMSVWAIVAEKERNWKVGKHGKDWHCERGGRIS